MLRDIFPSLTRWSLSLLVNGKISGTFENGVALILEVNAKRRARWSCGVSPEDGKGSGKLMEGRGLSVSSKSRGAEGRGGMDVVLWPS